MLRLAGADREECLVKLVERKSGSGVEWVVEKTETEIAKEAEREAEKGEKREGPCGVVIPWIFAAVDPEEKWWERLRGNPKRAGEISQAAFLLKAEMMGFHLALPWGDSERYDFVVWGRGGTPVMRVQVKGTGRLHRRGYEVQPVHSTRKGGRRGIRRKTLM